MRQLLGRKSKLRLSDDQDATRTSTPSAVSRPVGLAGERVFPSQSSRPGLSLNVRDEGSKFDTARAQLHLNALRSRPNDGQRSPTIRNNAGVIDGSEPRKVTDRSQYVSSSKSGPPRVVVGAAADPNSAAYRRCEDEPIHTPGAIQNFGALLGLKHGDNGNLEVRIASENTRKILGYGPEQLFALPSFLDVLKPDFRNEMLARVNHVLRDVAATREDTRLDVFQIVLTFPYEPEIRLWCAVHLALNPQGLVVCEFEEYSDSSYLEDVEAAKVLPVTPFHFDSDDVLPDDFKKSTTSASEPLPAFEIARQRENREFSSLDLFNALCQAEKQLASCKSVQEALDVSVGLIGEATGFHRIMFYRFDSQKNGRVDAELLNPRASTDFYRGLSFPASDIPKQAQALYKINRIRLLHDRDATTARLVCRKEKEFETPLDLTHSYLRAISPVHLKYLVNIGVRSTMSISIVINSELWGLIACHGYGDAGVRVSLPIRELCRSIGECTAVNIQRLLMQESLKARKLLAANQHNQDPRSFSPNSSTDLLRLVDADFALLSIGGNPRAIGKLDPQSEAVAIMVYLQSRTYTSIRCSQNIKADFPGLIRTNPGINTIAGLLLVPLNVGEGKDFLVFFRRVENKNVQWAGDPRQKTYKPGSQYLEPRSSFKRWAETIVDTSREWTTDQLDTASVLGLFYEQFIDMWPQNGSTGSNRLSLIRDSSEKIRSRFGAVMNSLETALEHSIDDKTRDALVKAETASTALLYMMDNLLKLTETDNSPIQSANPIQSNSPVQPVDVNETFNLNLTASRIMKLLQKETQRKGLDLTVSAQVQQLPTMVKGNGDRFRQVLEFFANNAFKRSMSAKIDISLLRSEIDTSVIALTVQDNGPTMSEAELDDVFQEFEQAQAIDDWALQNGHVASSPNDVNGGASVDLTFIAGYVQKMNGQIRVSSELGKGTAYTLELPFEHAPSSDVTKRKLRNIFLPSHGPPKGPPPQSLPSPIKVQPSSKLPSPRTGQFDQALGVYNAQDESTSHSPKATGRGATSPVNLNVLIADGNASTLRVLDERLSQWGHNVDIASDGQECHERFAADPSKVDVILMDLQMPLSDGVVSTRMIRFTEKEAKSRNQFDARELQGPNHRVAIIAVSSSMLEQSRFDYIQNGFDGWIIKPIDLQRLDLILQGVKNARLRMNALFVPGQWEKGGWLSL